jgi:hypothetical protein
MLNVLDNLPVATILALLVAIVGGVIAILHPDTLSFSGYCQDVGIAVGGLGVLGIARSQAGKGTKRR